MIATSNVLGVGVSATNLRGAATEIDRWIAAGERHYVCVSGVHGIMESQRDPEVKAIHNRAGLVLPDGMPLAWWVRSQHRDADRVCGPEFMPLLLDRSQRTGYGHFFYGSSEKALADLQKTVGRRYPEARIVGSYSPPFRPLNPEEDAAIVAAINASGADIVWVGLSTPKQEQWMAAHRAQLDARVLIGVGAAFDLLAGHVERAPKFIRRTGFEWAYRLMIEPRRLWRRYLMNNPVFMVMAAAQVTRLAKFPLER